MSDTGSGHLDDQQHHPVNTEGRAAAAANSTAEVRRKTERSIVTEVGIFCIGIGVLLGVVGGLVLAMLRPPELSRLPSHLVLGTPIMAVATLNLASGILLLVMRNSGTVVLCMLAGASVMVLYFGWNLATGVGLGWCVSLVIFAISAALFLRGREALAELSGSRYGKN